MQLLFEGGDVEGDVNVDDCTNFPLIIVPYGDPRVTDLFPKIINVNQISFEWPSTDDFLIRDQYLHFAARFADFNQLGTTYVDIQSKVLDFGSEEGGGKYQQSQYRCHSYRLSN